MGTFRAAVAMALSTASLLSVLSVLWSASPARSEEAEPSVAPARRITLHMPHEVATLDWNLSNTRIDSEVIQNIHEGLLGFSTSPNPKAALAEKWEVSADGKRYTFHLRKGVLWSDGVPLKAQHFVDSFKRLLSPNTVTGNAYFLFSVPLAEEYKKGRVEDFSKVGIKALSDSVLEIKLKRPVSSWLWNLANVPSFPIRIDLIDKYGDRFWTAPGNLVTLGPYLLRAHQQDAHYVLARNPHYYGKSSNVDEVKIEIMPDSKAIEAFDKGKLDLVCYVGEKDRRRFAQDPRLHWFEPIRTKRLDFNFHHYPTDNSIIREAIARAIDRKALAQLLGPGFTAATSAAPPSLPSYSKSIGLAYDKHKAKALFRRTGLEGVVVELLVPLFDENAEETELAAKTIKQMLEEALPMKVNIRAYDRAEGYAVMRDTGQYSLLIRDWSVDLPIPGPFYYFYESSTHKSSTWKSASYDLLLHQAREESSAAKRNELYRQADALLTESELGVLPLYYGADASLLSKRITGYQNSAFDACSVRDLSVPR